jgi:hypothetical protein
MDLSHPISLGLDAALGPNQGSTSQQGLDASLSPNQGSTTPVSHLGNEQGEG